MAAPPKNRLRVPERLAGERLDRALAQLVEGSSRARCQKWIRAGRVRVDGLVVRRGGTILAAGAEIEIERPPPPSRPGIEEARRRLRVLHADEHVIAVDKQAGMLSHGGEGSAEAGVSELAHALFGALPSAQGEGRPGLVHRLDRDTSGVLVLGRTAPALGELMRQFREREVEKTYLALVHGEPRFDSDWIEKELGRSPTRPDRIAVMPEGYGREASTYYEVRERFGDFALLACKPRTGRMHQIRVHLSAIGHPLVGEPLYRRRNIPSRPIEAGAPPAERHLLHAAEIQLRHPASGETIAFQAPMPIEFERWLAWLRERAERRGGKQRT